MNTIVECGVWLLICVGWCSFITRLSLKYFAQKNNVPLETILAFLKSIRFPSRGFLEYFSRYKIEETYRESGNDTVAPLMGRFLSVFTIGIYEGFLIVHLIRMFSIASPEYLLSYGALVFISSGLFYASFRFGHNLNRFQRKMKPTRTV